VMGMAFSWNLMGRDGQRNSMRSCCSQCSQRAVQIASQSAAEGDIAKKQPKKRARGSQPAGSAGGGAERPREFRKQGWVLAVLGGTRSGRCAAVQAAGRTPDAGGRWSVV
jgi:hypothetical protein